MKKIFVWAVLSLLLASCGENRRLLEESYGREVQSSGPLESAVISGSDLFLDYKNLSLCLSAADGLLRVRANVSNATKERYSYAVIQKPEFSEVSELESSDDDGKSRVFSSGELRYRISTQEAKIEIRTSENEAVCSFFVYEEEREPGIFFLFDDAASNRYFGLGEKTGDFELTGRKFTFWNSDTYKYTAETDPIYSSFPFYYVIQDKNNYACFFDSPAYGEATLGDEHSFYVRDTQVDAYFFAPKNSVTALEETLSRYVKLTGSAALPPFWALGAQQSRYSYTNEAHARFVADSYRENDLPLDVLYFDIGFMDGKKSFTSDEENFPDPEGLMSDLEAMGIRTVAIVDPGIKKEDGYAPYDEGTASDIFCYYSDGDKYSGTVWPGRCRFPDFTKDETAEWWKDQHEVFLEWGIDGIWNDMNEPSVFNGPGGTMPDDVLFNNHGDPQTHEYLHNIYGLSMIENTYCAMTNLTDSRVFLLSRSGYSGAQRYAFMWTGDNTANWDHLRMNLSMALSLSISGMPFMGADVGGYTGSPSEELMTRWYQLAVFLPFFRNHTESGTLNQEPYEFEESIEAIRSAMKLRYRLLPYLYTAVFLAHESADPVVKPLWWSYGEDYLDVDSEFLFGEDLLICPVLKKGAEEIEIVIPEGRWINLQSGEIFESGSYTLEVTRNDIPVFAREGSVIPALREDYASTMEIGEAPELIFYTFLDKNGVATGSLYEDDGESFDFESGEYALYDLKVELDDASFEKIAGNQNSLSTSRIDVKDVIELME